MIRVGFGVINDGGRYRQPCCLDGVDHIFGGEYNRSWSRRRRSLTSNILLRVAKCPELRKQYPISRIVFGVVLEDCSLEILNLVDLSVEFGVFIEFVGDGVPLLSQSTMIIPVLQE